MAGANFTVNATARGVDFSFSGYSDSLKPLVDYSLKNIRLYAKHQGVVTDLSKLESFRQALVRQYRNEKKQTPYRQLMGDLAATIYQPYWSSQVMADALEQLDLTQLPAFVHTLLQQSEVISLSTGNLTPRTAKKLAKHVRKVLVQGRSFAPNAEARVVQLSDTRALDVAALHQDNAVMLYFQGQQQGQEQADSVAEQARLMMLGQILSTPFYAELRTQQQLGYIVFGSYYPVRAMPGLVFLVQSPDTPIDDIYRAMTSFLTAYQPDFAAQFRMHQLALVGELTEAPKNLGEVTGRYWQDLNEGNMQFNHDQQLQRAIETLNPKDFEAWYRTFISQSLAKNLVIYSQKPSVGTAQASPKGLLEALPRLDLAPQSRVFRYP
ncbi:MAG: insulinase family protein [Marinagarivorans sp.]|nr:insulinase family protein [Marinagarivorans sp.]